MRTATTDIVPIETLLSGLGYSSQGARQAARLLMETHGLTNPRKRRIHAGKHHRTKLLLRRHLVRVCASQECTRIAGRSRQQVTVAPIDCEICCGRATARALGSLTSSLIKTHVRRLLVVGGAPDTHKELWAAFTGSHVRLDVIDGTHTPDRARARALGSRADVIVIWASTILPHAVSTLFRDRSLSEKTITVSRRGVEALALSVEEHLARKGGARGYLG